MRNYTYPTFNLPTGREVRNGRSYSVALELPAGDMRTTYAKLRKLGAPAQGALRTARTLERWRALEDSDTFRLLYVSDDDGASALDWLEQSADDMAQGNVREWEATRKRERSRANDDGVYGLLGQFRTSDAEEWEDGDSVWGFIGDDGRDVGGYAPDVIGSTLDALDKARGACCATCGRPALAT